MVATVEGFLSGVGGSGNRSWSCLRDCWRGGSQILDWNGGWNLDNSKIMCASLT